MSASSLQSVKIEMLICGRPVWPCTHGQIMSPGKQANFFLLPLPENLPKQAYIFKIYSLTSILLAKKSTGAAQREHLAFKL